jgi:hypothetical protein
MFMSLKKTGLLLLLIFFSIAGYCQDEVREEISTADDYSHYLETIADSVQYLKDSWVNDLTKINDADHDYARIRKSTNNLLKFLKDKKHDVKILGAIGNKGDALKNSYTQYLSAEIELITKYYVPFADIKGSTAEADFNNLNNQLKQENEQEKSLTDTLTAAKDAYENDNNLSSENAEE